MWKDNLVMCFTKVRLILFIYTSIGVHKKPSRLSNNRTIYIYMTRYILTVGTGSAHQWG